jgi:ribose-phosphate pyrophosphokinase
MPQFERISIFTGNAHPQLAGDIARQMNRPLGRIEVTQFRDGETHVQIMDDIRGADVFIVQPTSPPVNQNLMELLIMIDAANRASAGRITAVIPYYGYARQEKKTHGREPISAKLVANLVTVAGADRVLTMDLSAPAIEGFFDIPMDHLTAVPLLAQHVRTLGLENVAVVAPDVGAVQRADRFRQLLAQPAGQAANLPPLAILFKERPRPDEVLVQGMVGEVKGRCAIMVDDLISTGNTLIAAAELLMQRGATSVLAVATHGVFVGDAIERLGQSHIQRVIVTNTIPLMNETSVVEVVDIAGVLAEVLNRVHFGISVSDLMRQKFR